MIHAALPHYRTDAILRRVNLDRYDDRDDIRVPKNPTIAKFYKEIGWVDELGSGVRNTYKYNKLYSGANPTFIEGDVFKTIIPLTEQATEQANEEVKKLLEFCKVPRTRSEMQEFVGIKSRSYFSRKILNPLINGRLLKLTIPDKPRSPKQKYYSENR